MSDTTPPARRRRWLVPAVLVLLGGVAVVVARQPRFRGPEDPWAAATASPTTAFPTAVPTPIGSDDAGVAPSTNGHSTYSSSNGNGSHSAVRPLLSPPPSVPAQAGPVDEAAPSVAAPSVAESAVAEPEPPTTEEPADEIPTAEIPSAETPEQAVAESPYGPGSALPLPDGSAPGPEFTIKGNAGSMLFHPPTSPYYGRTRAEVWFTTPEAATAAGFTAYRTRRRTT